MRLSTLGVFGFGLVSSAMAAVGDFEVPDDEVQLVKGKPVSGRVVHVDSERLVMRKKSRLVTLERSKVASYTSINEELSSVMPDLGIVSQSLETAGMAQLAKSCADRGLLGEAALVWWNVLRLDPENEEAHLALGHSQSGDSWAFRLAETQMNMEKLAEWKPKWGKAYELSTTHFDVRSNMLWFDTVRASLMAEQIYVLIFHSLGDEFEMYWPTQRMTLHIHGEGSFPGGARFRGLVDYDGHRAAIDATEGFQPWFLTRHLSELILTEAIREEAAPTANFPMWMKIGMEEYTMAVLGFDQNEGDVIRFRPDNRHVLNRQIHRSAKDPFGLTRVLNFGDGDFKATDNELQRAECYTLFEYCLHGEGGKFRDAFMEYYGFVKSGKASTTDFKDAFGIRRSKEFDSFEQAWFEAQK